MQGTDSLSLSRRGLTIGSVEYLVGSLGLDVQEARKLIARGTQSGLPAIEVNSV